MKICLLVRSSKQIKDGSNNGVPVALSFLADFCIVRTRINLCVQNVRVGFLASLCGFASIVCKQKNYAENP